LDLQICKIYLQQAIQNTMKNHFFRTFGIIVAAAAASFYIEGYSQPLADMHVARFNDNKTPYPVYAGIFATIPRWNNNELRNLGQNFDALYGSYGDIDSLKANIVKQENPTFQFIRYIGNWSVSDRHGSAIRDIELNHSDDIMYYRMANLATTLDNTDTTFIIDDKLGIISASTAADSALASYRQGNTWKTVVCIKIDNEMMRLNSASGNTLTVTRGFRQTKPEKHKTGSAIICPVYSNGLNSGRLGYRHAEAGLWRWQIILNSIIDEYKRTGGGIWIDIIVGNLSVTAMNGQAVPTDRVWNVQQNRPYLPDERTKYAGIGVKMMQDSFKAKFGHYPVIWGNNMMFPTSLTDQRIGLLLQTPEKPRPLDGFAQENAFGSYGTGGNSGKEYYEVKYNEWLKNIQSIMFMGEQKLSARPLSLDGGIDNAKLALEPTTFRHRVQLFAYTSYLMAVKVEPDDRIFTAIGFTPIVGSSNTNCTLLVEPFLQWEIGRPTETRLSGNVLGYKLPGSKIFMRRFENGVVFVNPSDSTTESISLNQLNIKQTLYHPDQNNSIIKTIVLPPKNGMILTYNPQ